VNTGVGVYWMFYSGGNFEPAAAPPGLRGFREGVDIEGLRCLLPLTMGLSQARALNPHQAKLCCTRLTALNAC